MESTFLASHTMPNLLQLFLYVSLMFGGGPVILFALIGGFSNPTRFARRCGLVCLGIVAGLIVVVAASLLALVFLREGPPWYAVRMIGACCGSLVAFHLSRIGIKKTRESRAASELALETTESREVSEPVHSKNPYQPPQTQ